MKRYIVLFLLGLLMLPVNAQSRKKVGVVLSGGGAKGVAHVGALKVIEEAGIPIDIVVGTSMGSIVGGLYSIGYTPHQLDSMIRKQDWTFILTDRMQRSQKTFLEKVESEKYVLSLPFHKNPGEVMPDGIVKGQNLHNLFADLTIGYHDSIDFNKLPIPFACVAVDLMEGKEVVFHSGRLSEAMRASMAIPAAFTPVRLDSMVLVDGGLLNNFPVDVARAMGAEVVIGVDVQSGPEAKDKISGLVDMINKLTDMTGQEKYNRNLKDTDLYIKVDVKGYTAASFTTVALDTLMTRGEFAARTEWENLNQLKHKIGINNNFVPEKNAPYVFLSEDNPILVRNISFRGASKKDAERLKEKGEIFENTHITMKDLRLAVDKLYSLQTYTNITYNFSQNGDAYDLEFVVESNTPNSINLGVRFDLEEIAAVQVNASYQFKTKLATRAIVTGRIGKRASAQLDYLILPSALRYINLSYKFQYTDMNIYSHGDRAYNTTYSQHFGDIGYSSILSRNLRMSLGLRYEYYNYSTFLFNNTENNMTVKPEGFFSYYGILRYETTDKKSYPTKGMSLHADLSIYTDNLSSYKDNTPFGAACAWWEGVFSLTRRFSLLPSFYGRVLFGQDSPYPYMNVLGGDVPGRYMPQQIPFAGINYMEVVDNSVMVGALKFRQRMGKNNYVSFITNYGLTENDLGRIFKGSQLFGMGVGYGYDSFFGPIEATLNISNRTKQLGFYFNVGYRF
ncbi:patatin-like phospholipase family protein [Bacteroides sp. 224]|uniref:patatin-like phospholipase family protein n=1 Tax=Bacteroides sp. 224 TaxID=2302936 RepID=UPI0013D2FDF2|nr:patatin-like phospholipase family protein [Bacteroides sp. 224]NDV66857.1 patatin [Bacteroides sp. 224]